MPARHVCLLILVTVGGGCATGFNRAKLREAMDGQLAVTDQDIGKALSLKPQLPKPFRLGVFFTEPENRRGSQSWRWTEEDKTKIVALADPLKAANEVSEVFAISDATISKTDLKSIRLAAAQHGADAVLVVSGIKDVDSYLNGWACTYFAVVPVLFVPGSVTDSLFMARAAMWDVRNEFLYMTADSESLKKQTRPAAFTNERKVSDQAKTEALDKLREEISKRFHNLSSQKR